jgi:hypothetical protein
VCGWFHFALVYLNLVLGLRNPVSSFLECGARLPLCVNSSQSFGEIRESYVEFGVCILGLVSDGFESEGKIQREILSIDITCTTLTTMNNKIT